jgi:hypothetical protein
MLEGALKYGRHNYRVAPVCGTVYTDSACRHIDAWLEGEDIDKASGVHHLSKAAADLLLLRDATIMGKWVDDRPPQYPNLDKDDILAGLNKQARDLIERYKNPRPPHTHVGETQKENNTAEAK